MEVKMNQVSTQLVTVGTEDSPTQIIFVRTNNTLAEVLVAGYLTANLLTRDLGQLSIYQMAVVYTSDAGCVLLQVTTANGVWSLAQTTEVSELSYTGTLTVDHLMSVNNASGVLEDSGIAKAQVMQLGVTNTMASGAMIVAAKGTGTVNAGAVAINQQAGVITTTSLTTAAGATATFTLTNSKITTASVINVTVMGGTNTIKNFTVKAESGNGTSLFTIANNDPADPFDGTLILGFKVE